MKLAAAPAARKLAAAQTGSAAKSQINLREKPQASLPVRSAGRPKQSFTTAALDNHVP
jgi:hypothetical protein